ncbi:MAG TPA: aminobutyraldehyde dehydrogenase [Pseudoclavibacter sp.]|nr:aminobutyraldehyde dehydrogenase [Pseudoclavibacter sp.]
MTRLKNFIGGEYVESVSPDSMELVDPDTERVYGESPVSTREDVDTAYRAAAEGARVWGKQMTPGQRQLALFRIADEVEQRADEIAQLESEDTGKPLASLVADEILPSVDQIRFFAGAARNLTGLASGEYMPNHTSSIRREPLGVVGQVTPWNYPFNMATWKFAPALAAGNATVLKPSDTTPQSTLLLAEIVARHVPAGVLNVVLGDRTTGEHVVTHPTPALVSITGSVRAGTEVAISASADLKRLHLELGGKAPCIVFADADLDAAAEGIAAAGLFNAGQDCTAATRVLVHASIAEEFAQRLASAASSLRTGERHDPDAYFGPVNNAHQFSRVMSVIEGMPEHATVLTGGHRAADRGYFIEPTVVTGLRQDDDPSQKEIFGPVITIQTFETEQEALDCANGVEYGLASSVWTRDTSIAGRCVRDLDFGCVWVNTHIPIVAEMPHGGYKHSGYGKDLSMYAFEEYTRIKHVMTYIG